MNERLLHRKSEKEIYGLRTASISDLEFLFRVSTEAMKPVNTALNSDKNFDQEEEFKKYQSKFVPEEIEIITYSNQDIGRLRVVRNSDCIYIGGIQILPEFQGKGIGTALFSDLIRESNKNNVPITLEVHDVNVNALKFYTNLGFEKGGHEGNKARMQYTPVLSSEI